MNCPGHCQIYNQGLKSYKDLPLKLSEFGKVHRYEPSGSLHGLMRVRSFTQDDAHIFCTEDQITEESVKVTKLILDIYKAFGFENITLKYADRPAKSAADEPWRIAAVGDRADDGRGRYHPRLRQVTATFCPCLYR